MFRCLTFSSPCLVLGYLSFTVAFFVGLAPHWVLGLELASIFAIFTSQAWNMAFSFFQALRTLPLDLDEASRAFGFSAWQRFWRLEFPFAVPGLVWNMMMSMSGGWFFVVASEAITADQRQIALPGIGSYVALAIAQRNLAAIGFAIAAMTIVIVIYDQLLFRPLVVWADKFRVEQTASQSTPHSWFLELLRRSHMAQAAAVPVTFCLRSLFRARIFNIIPASRPVTIRSRASRAIDVLWYIVVAAAALWLAAIVVRFVARGAGWSDVLTVLRLGAYTLLRVIVLIVLASMIWVPVGVAIGLRPQLAERVQPLAQFLAAFPANLLFPLFVIPIVRFKLNTDIWLTPLMILGTQWYILFNVIAGTTALPTDLLEAASNFRFHGWQWWRIVILPGIFPYYITGAITASGGAWNASIVAEVVSWGHDHIFAHGLGAYISPDDGAGRLSAHRPRHRDHVGLCRSVQSPVVAAPLCLRRAPVQAGLRTCHEQARRNKRGDRRCRNRFRHVRQTYARASGAPLLVLDDINLTLREGEVVGLLGRSGCGKSTLLRLVSGLAPPASGEVFYRGKAVEGPVDGIAMVFQTFALFPWLTVLQNVQAGLDAKGCRKRRRASGLSRRSNSSASTDSKAPTLASFPAACASASVSHVRLSSIRQFS